MLSEDTIKEINEQIQILLVQHASAISDYRRGIYMRRIHELKTLLGPDPMKIDYDVLADAVVERLTPKPKEPETLSEIISSILTGTR